jgi:hypothetical protein
MIEDINKKIQAENQAGSWRTMKLEECIKIV